MMEWVKDPLSTSEGGFAGNLLNLSESRVDIHRYRREDLKLAHDFQGIDNGRGAEFHYRIR